MYNLAGRGVVVVSVLVGGVETYRGYHMFGGQFGYNAQRAIASSAGGLVGAKVEACGGAAVGVWFEGFGAVPGVIIGGFVGGFTGSNVRERSINYYPDR